MNTQNKTCFICRRAVKRNDAFMPQNGHVRYIVSCDRCGTYELSDWAMNDLDRLEPIERIKVSYWVRQCSEPPTITVDNLPGILAQRPLRFIEKADRLLVLLAQKATRIDTRSEIITEPMVAELQVADTSDLGQIAKFLHDESLIKFANTDGVASLTPRGLMRAESLIDEIPSSTQAFVAMWFADEMTPIWEKGFQAAIRASGYTPMRIDQKEHANKICDEIIAEIRRSKFVVADYTGHRGGVYFESGYAMGRGLTVISTCRQDDIGKLHFDIRQYNCISWTAADDLADKLKARIGAVIGDGPQPRTA